MIPKYRGTAASIRDAKNKVSEIIKSTNQIMDRLDDGIYSVLRDLQHAEESLRSAATNLKQAKRLKDV
jgi:hypothetical protein